MWRFRGFVGGEDSHCGRYLFILSLPLLLLFFFVQYNLFLNYFIDICLQSWNSKMRRCEGRSESLSRNAGKTKMTGKGNCVRASRIWMHGPLAPKNLLRLPKSAQENLKVLTLSYLPPSPPPPSLSPTPPSSLLPPSSLPPSPPPSSLPPPSLLPPSSPLPPPFLPLPSLSPPPSNCKL